MILVSKFAKKKGSSNFSSSEFANYTGYPLHQIEPYLMNLSNKGFLFYNVSTNRVVVLEKLYKYVNARREIGDYDVIRFNSKVIYS